MLSFTYGGCVFSVDPVKDGCDVYLFSVCPQMLELVKISCLTAEYMNYNRAEVKKLPRAVASTLYSVRSNSPLGELYVYLVSDSGYLRSAVTRCDDVVLGNGGLSLYVYKFDVLSLFSVNYVYYFFSEYSRFDIFDILHISYPSFILARSEFLASTVFCDIGLPSPMRSLIVRSKERIKVLSR